VRQPAPRDEVYDLAPDYTPTLTFPQMGSNLGEGKKEKR